MQQYLNEMPLPEKSILALENEDVPAFMKKYSRYNRRIPVIDASFVGKLIKWAECEYADTLNYYQMVGNIDCFTRVKSLSFLNVIAHSHAFRIIQDNITQEMWDRLPNAYQEVLVRANKKLQ